MQLGLNGLGWQFGKFGQQGTKRSDLNDIHLSTVEQKQTHHRSHVLVDSNALVSVEVVVQPHVVAASKDRTCLEILNNCRATVHLLLSTTKKNCP